MGVVVVVVVDCGAVADGFGVWDWDCDCAEEVASAASRSMLRKECVREREKREGRWCNALDFGLEVLFFFGSALDCTGVFCVRLRIIIN